MTTHNPTTAMGSSDAGSRSYEPEDAIRAAEMQAALRRGQGKRTSSGGFPGEFRSLVHQAHLEYWREERVRSEAAAAGLAPDEVWILVRAMRESAGEETGIRLSDGRPIRIWLTPALRSEVRQVEALVQEWRAAILANAHRARRRESVALARLAADACAAEGDGGGCPSGQADSPAKEIEQHLRRAEWLARRPMSPEVLAELAINWNTLISRQSTAFSAGSSHEEGHFAKRRRGSTRTIKQATLITRPGQATIAAEGDPAGRAPQDFCVRANEPYCAGLDHPLVRAALLKLWAAHLCGGHEPSVGGAAVVRWTLCRAGRRELAVLPLSAVWSERPDAIGAAAAAAVGDEADATSWVIEHVRAARDLLETRVAEFAENPQLRAEVGPSSNTATKRADSTGRWRGTRAGGDGSLNRRQRDVIQATAADPARAVTIAEHQREQGVAFATARADLLGLAALGLLVRRKAGRKFVFESPRANQDERALSGDRNDELREDRPGTSHPPVTATRVRSASNNDFGYDL